MFRGRNDTARFDTFFVFSCRKLALTLNFKEKCNFLRERTDTFNKIVRIYIACPVFFRNCTK